MQVFDTLKIPIRCFGTRDTLKKGNLPYPFLHTFSFRFFFFHLCQVLPLNDKQLPCAGSGQELEVNIAVPPLPKLLLNKFHLCAIRWNLEKSIVWIFQDLPVIHPIRLFV